MAGRRGRSRPAARRRCGWVDSARRAQERALAQRMADAVAADYRAVIAEAEAPVGEPDVGAAPHGGATSPRAAAHRPPRLLPTSRARAGPARAVERSRRQTVVVAMRWATRAGCHVDRAACAWLIRRFIDADAEFVFVDDPDEVPADATPFDMRGRRAVPSRRGLHLRDDAAPLRSRRPGAVGRRSDRPRGRPRRRPLRRPRGGRARCRSAAGCRWSCADDEVLAVTGPMFDGLYEYRRRALLLGRDPA